MTKILRAKPLQAGSKQNKPPEGLFRAASGVKTMLVLQNY